MHHTKKIIYKERYEVQTKKKYGLMKFAFDALLFFLTGGLWLIWIFVREMRNR